MEGGAAVGIRGGGEGIVSDVDGEVGAEDEGSVESRLEEGDAGVEAAGEALRIGNAKEEGVYALGVVGGVRREGSTVDGRGGKDNLCTTLGTLL